MTFLIARKTGLALAMVGAVALSACSTNQVVDNTVGVAAGATKVVAKGTVKAGKAVYKGGKKLVVGSK